MHPLVRSARRAVKAVVHPILAPAAIQSFRSRAAGCPSWREALDLSVSFHFGRIRIAPVQVRSEIEAFLELVAARAPRIVLEIGTAEGGTLFLFTRVATPDAIMVSVDLPGGPFGGGYPSWKTGLYRSFARPGQEISLVRGDSHAPVTAKSVSERLRNQQIDLLFIDGDHTYEGVKADFEMYSPLVRPGGLIAFHDIVPGPEEAVGGVPRLWQELKGASGSREIVADWSQGGYGIGTITRETS
jgi:predicted O-methyltransferase YrrM